MRRYLESITAFGVGLAWLLGDTEISPAQDNTVTAIDIALEPDATMVQHARTDNARLLKDFPEGFALDATHHPHITMLQQFVRTADLDKVYSGAEEVLIKENVAGWKLKAFKYYYIPAPPNGIAGIVVEPSTEKTGTPAAFASTEDGRDIQPGLIDYVANFVTIAAGRKFNPHVTIGVAPQTYLDKRFTEPFEAFTFSPVGAVVYQLGTFGTARKELQRFSLTR
jgi:2'-5' RNA ligase